MSQTALLNTVDQPPVDTLSTGQVLTATFADRKGRHFVYAPKTEAQLFTSAHPDAYPVAAMLDSSSDSMQLRAYIFHVGGGVDDVGVPLHLQFGSCIDDALESYCDNNSALEIKEDEWDEETCSHTSDGRMVCAKNVSGFEVALIGMTFEPQNEAYYAAD